MYKQLIPYCLIALLFNPKTTFSQAPNLGAASGFILFTAGGAFINSGASTITGDIGTDGGAFSGFPPGTLNGEAHIVDSTSAQAAIDVNLAYNYLFGLTCDTVIGTSLGGGQVLPPQVYCIGAASSLTGNLILDGQGDSSALFIIKIDGALSLSASSTITLINSAVCTNVFWQVNGAFNLGANATFRGTLLNFGAISLLEASSIFGRGLSCAGEVSLQNNNLSNLCSDGVYLPIELIFFKATCENENINIEWATATEFNNDYFTIENSINGENWEKVAQINGMGNSTTLINYSIFLHPTNTFGSYFRLKQTDYDGEFRYSQPIYNPNCSKKITNLKVYPNPGTGKFHFFMNEVQGNILSTSVYNEFGKLMYVSFDEPTVIDLSNEQNGIYFLHCNTSSETIVKKIVLIK